MSKKRICLLAVGLTLLLAAGFFLALPRTLFDEPFSATVWSRDGRLLSAKVAPDGQWRFFPTDSVPGKFRTAITTYEDKRFDRHFGVDPLALARAVGQNLAAGRIESGASTLTDHPFEPRREAPDLWRKVRRSGAGAAARNAVQ